MAGIRDRTDSNIKYEPATAEDEDHAGNCCTKTKSWFTKFPKATWPILITEFGERFSYYGIKTVLVLYLTKDLMFNKPNGKSIYHAFSMTSYFTGVIGAMIADSWLGKYRTIAYTLFLYSISEILLTLTSVDTIGQRNSIGPLISLFAMAIACGNIKPCLAAFGGDQFRKDQEHMLELFFAMFYASVNVGAVLCMWFIPMVRTDVQCFGRDCYPAVFAINTVLIIAATIISQHLRLDRGSETGIMATIHAYLRQTHEDVDASNTVHYGPSTNNKIERWWRELHNRLEKFFKRQLRMLLEKGYYDPDDEIDRHMLAFVFIPVIQKEMDIFRETIWNSHRVRSQKEAQMPKGIPNHLYSFPESYGAQQCGLPVTQEALNGVAEMSGVMTFGEDFLPVAVRTECEWIIPDVDGIEPTDAADTFLFLKAHYNQEHST